MRQRQDDRPAGFTLVEMLIVIVVLGVLIAMVVPTIRPTRESGALAAVRSDATGLAMALEADYSRTRSYPVIASFTSNGAAVRGAVVSPGVELRITGHTAGGTGALLELRTTQSAAVCRLGLGDQRAGNPLICTP